MNTLPSTIVAPPAKISATPASAKGGEVAGGPDSALQQQGAIAAASQAPGDAGTAKSATAPFSAVLTASSLAMTEGTAGMLLPAITGNPAEGDLDPAELVDSLVELSISAGIQAAGQPPGQAVVGDVTGMPAQQSSGLVSAQARSETSNTAAAILGGAGTHLTAASGAAAAAASAAAHAGTELTSAPVAPAATHASGLTRSAANATQPITTPVATGNLSDQTARFSSQNIGPGPERLDETAMGGSTVRNQHTISSTHTALNTTGPGVGANGATAQATFGQLASDNIVSPDAEGSRVRNNDTAPQSSGTINLLQTSAQAQAASRPVVLPQINMPQVPAQGFDQPLAARVSYMVDAGITNARIRLNPEHLGAIELNLTITGKAISAAFSSTQADVRLAIEASLPKLREQIEASGMELTDAQVGGDEARNGKDHHQNLLAQVMDMAAASDKASRLSTALEGGQNPTVDRQGSVDTDPQRPPPLPQSASFEILI